MSVAEVGNPPNSAVTDVAAVPGVGSSRAYLSQAESDQLGAAGILCTTVKRQGLEEGTVRKPGMSTS